MAWTKLTINTPVLTRMAQSELETTMESMGTKMETYARQLMSKSGGGRVYIRHGGRHQASAPGSPPAVDTGRLHDSLTHEIEISGTRVTLRFGTDVKYGVYLELGTRRMAARPFLRPTMAAVTI